MEDDYKKFVETLSTNKNTIKVVNSLHIIGNYDYKECTPVDLEQIILSMKPNSPKSIVTICYVLSLYAKYLNDDRLYYMVQDINRSTLWLKAKPYASKKFISHTSFDDVCRDIDIYEDFNSFRLKPIRYIIPLIYSCKGRRL